MSASGVGERIMAVSLAKTAAQQLQGEAHTPPTQAAQRVLRGQLLNRPGPWDSGFIAVRVADSSIEPDGDSFGSGFDTTQSKGSSADDDSGDPTGSPTGKGATAEAHTAGGDSVEAACGNNRHVVPAPGQAGDAEGREGAGVNGPAVASKQPSAAPMLRVEFVAAFTAPSFAVGYLAQRSTHAPPLSEVSVLRSSCQQGLANAAAPPADEVEGCGVLPSGPPGVSCMEVCCCWPLQ